LRGLYGERDDTKYVQEVLRGEGLRREKVKDLERDFDGEGRMMRDK
jgi:hypothetical protein